ncbi:MAG: hypothetical protein AAB666_01180 [Patescibacteria group bacterium]
MFFYLQLAISFLVGGIFIALQTLFAERVPLAWRGIVLTIPSTVAIGLFFIGLTKTPADVVSAAQTIPAALAPTYTFVMTFAMLVNHGIWFAMPAAFLMWGLFAFVILEFPPAGLATSVFLFSLPAIVLAYLIIRKLPQVHTLKKFPLNAKHIAGRSLLGGTIIVLATVFAKTLGNTWGALLSAFPAVFSSTFIIFYNLHGKEVIPAAAKSLFFPGAIGLIIYAIVAAFTFPSCGIWIGTLLAYLGSLSFAVVYYLIKDIDVETLPS